MSSEEYIFLNESEFKGLSDKEKWNYVTSLVSMLKSYRTQAEKNCAECEKNLIEDTDINIGLYFEDWRHCKEMSDDCENCGKEERTYMCDIQFNLINHIANELGSLQDKYNKIVKLILKKEDPENNILDKLKTDIDKAKERDENADNMFQ